MYSLKVIKSMNKRAHAKAVQEDMQPFIFFNEEEVGNLPQQCLPEFGDYRPTRWKMREETLFCDSSGWGSSDEPALSVEQTRDTILRIMRETEGTVGFAVIETGQFQVYVGVFDKVEKPPRKEIAGGYDPRPTAPTTPKTSHGIR